MRKIFTDKVLTSFLNAASSVISQKEDMMEEVDIGEVELGNHTDMIPFILNLDNYSDISFDPEDSEYYADEMNRSSRIYLAQYSGENSKVHVPATYTIGGKKLQVVISGIFMINYNIIEPAFCQNSLITEIILDDGVEIPGWKTDTYIDIVGMFAACSNLERIEFRHKNLIIENNITVSMFGGCSSLTSLDLTMFDTHNVTDMSYMFYGCTNLTEILVSRDKWVISEGCNTTNMFEGCGTDHVTYVD